MAVITASDLVIRDKEYYGGQIERIADVFNLFNARAADAIRYRNQWIEGQYEKTDFFPLTTSMIRRQDITSNSTVTDSEFTATEIVKVKMHQLIKPTSSTLKAWRMVKKDPSTFSYIMGQKIADAKWERALTLAISAAAAAIQNVGTTVYLDLTSESTKYISTDALARTVMKFGDRASDIAVWVMHSQQFWDLVRQDLSDKVDTVFAAVRVSGALTQALGRPIIITDNDSLVNAATGTSTSTSADDVAASYNVLGLTRGAVEIDESEPEDIVIDTVTGEEQLRVRYQGEYALNFGLKGFTWDTTNGGANPTDATIGTGSNWDKVATDIKDTAGVLLKVRARS